MKNDKLFVFVFNFQSMIDISKEKFLVFSDDLTGANGVSGMMSRFSRAITVNSNIIFSPEKISPDFDSITINTKTRMLNGKEAFEIIENLKKRILKNKIRFGKRIDSTLRGNIEMEALPFLEGNAAIMTDTIPEYGRYTMDGNTITPDGSMNIIEKFSKLEAIQVKIDELKRTKIENGKVYVVDSKDYNDIEKIAYFIHRNGYFPMDPGPLCSAVSRFNLKERNEKIYPPRVSNILYIIGSMEKKTEMQIKHAVSMGIELFDINDFKTQSLRAAIIRLNYFVHRHLINQEFINNVKNYDSYVLSGGETANTFFEASNGLFIESLGDFMPLVGIGRLIGGILHGKIVVTKGGMIGSENVYMRILDYLTSDNYDDKNRYYSR